MRSRRVLWLAVVGVAATAWPVAGQGFVPTELKNIKVLPKDMTPRQVVEMMRGFTAGLGVRCSYCHVQQPGQSMAETDFAADDKVTKQKARVMISMVQAINGDVFPTLPMDHSAGRETPLSVRCETCHRGQPVPYTLEERLHLVLDDPQAGADSAVATYRALRAEYYGRATYDFSEQRLVGVAAALIEDGRADDALALLRVNLEFYPQSSGTVMTMGDAFAAKDNRDEAIRHYRWALELNPRNRAAQQRLQRIGGGGV